MGNVAPIIHSRTRLWKYNHYAGQAGSRFLLELRDNKRIMGAKCPNCSRVYVPPRSCCYVCFQPMVDWVEVHDEGTLVTFTITYEREPAYPRKVPFAYGVIKLDGADTNIVHIIDEVNPHNLKIGMRLKAVFKEERVGSIMDIKHFKPI